MVPMGEEQQALAGRAAAAQPADDIVAGDSAAPRWSTSIEARSVQRHGAEGGAGLVVEQPLEVAAAPPRSAAAPPPSA